MAKMLLQVLLLSMLVYPQDNVLFGLHQCCKFLATLRLPWFIPALSADFDKFQISTRHVDKQVCTHLES